MLCSQPYFPNVRIANGCAPCNSSGAVCPEELGLGASSSPCGKELGAQGQSSNAAGLSTESVRDATQAEWRKSSHFHFIFFIISETNSRPLIEKSQPFVRSSLLLFFIFF